MASGPFGADDSREKHRWAESNKVYTRKLHNKGHCNVNINNANTNSANNSKNTGGNVAQQSSQTIGTADDGNSSQQQILSRLDAASDDSSSLNRPHPDAANGYEPARGNGLLGFVKVDNRIKVANLSAISKIEARDIRRKLVVELDQVRSTVKKLEAREVQLGGYSSVGGYAHSQVSANEVIDKGECELRVHSVGLLRNSQPFRELSVSVIENNHGVDEFVEKEKRMPKANLYYQNSEFLLGKDKFPPPEKNKKLKSKKHGEQMVQRLGMDKNMTRVFRSCYIVLTKLMKHKHSWVFNAPVDVKGLGLHDYYSIIKHPMDLGTIKSRLSKNCYKSPREFAEDVRLTFQNAITYNPKGQHVHYMAELLLKIFDENWSALEAEYNLDGRHGMGHELSFLSPTSREVPPPLPLPSPEMRTLDRSESMAVDSKLKTTNHTPVGRTPVPKKPKTKDTTNHTPVGRTPVPKKPKTKDKDTHKRDMTYEEKQSLSTHLQSLPSEKLDNILQMIKKRNSALCQRDDEIEVDIDSVDAETLWELDRFVTNYKKSLSKNKRKTELALQARAEAGHSNQEINVAPAMVEPPKATNTDEKKVSNSSPVQGEKQGDCVTQSSSSSSSSSDSGSSLSGHSPRT